MVTDAQFEKLANEVSQIRRDFGEVIQYVWAIHRAILPLLPQIQANEEVDEHDIRRRRITHPKHHHVAGRKNRR